MRDARVGVDLVDVGAFAARMTGREDLLAEIFTAAELTYCGGTSDRWPHLAARFAAKEATLKALASGLTGGMRWRDVEVTRDPAGMPGLAIHGGVRETLARSGLDRATVSLSHTASHAVAVVLLFSA